MTALEKAESALHRGGDVMDTGAAFPPDCRPLPRTSGPWSPTPGRPVIAGVEATGEVLEAGQGVALTPPGKSGGQCPEGVDVKRHSSRTRLL